MRDLSENLIAAVVVLVGLAVAGWVAWGFLFGLGTAEVDGNVPPEREPVVQTSTSPAPLPDYPARSCVDVTSFDNNWQNDMRCTDEDGSVFFTDYAGADRFMAGG